MNKTMQRFNRGMIVIALSLIGTAAYAQCSGTYYAVEGGNRLQLMDIQQRRLGCEQQRG